MSARAVWTGSVTFGLVHFDAKLYKAADDRGSETAMNELHLKCSQQMNRHTFCPQCNVNVPASDIVKGVPVGGGKFVVLTKEELDTIKPESSDNILLDAFVPASEIDPLYIENSYYLTADGAASQIGYATLVAAMAADKLAGQGRLTIYGAERTVTLRPFGTTLVVQLMRTATQVRATDQLPGYIAPKVVVIAPEMKAMMLQLMGVYAGHFDASDYEDEYVKDFKALVASKVAGTATVAKAAKPVTPKTDLMAALKASLSASKVTKAKTPKTVAPLGPKSTKGKSTKKELATV